MGTNFTIVNNNERGSALIVVLIFSAIVSMALISMQNFVESDQAVASKYSLDTEFINLLHDIKGSIGADAFCNNTSVGLVGLRLTSGSNLNSLQAPTSLRIKIPGSNSDSIGPGWMNASRTLRFHSMSWDYQGAEPDSFVRATSVVRSRKFRYNLIVEMKRCKTSACNETETQYLTNEPRSNGSLNSNAVSIPLYIHLQANSAFSVISGARIVSCFSEGTGAAFCESTGSVWNPYASSINYMCEPKNHCYYNKALPNDTCGTTNDELIRYKPIVEGKGEMRPGKTPPSSPNVLVPSGDFDPNKLNIVNCAWCNPNI